MIKYLALLVTVKKKSFDIERKYSIILISIYTSVQNYSNFNYSYLSNYDLLLYILF